MAHYGLLSGSMAHYHTFPLHTQNNIYLPMNAVVQNKDLDKLRQTAWKIFAISMSP